MLSFQILYLLALLATVAYMVAYTRYIVERN